MSKKLTDSDKWRDTWFRKLSPNEKLVFLFLIDQCNHGGFYEVDLEYMSFCIGIARDEIPEAIQGLNRGCFYSDGWVWVKNYLRHQKNEILNPNNNAHRHIIERVREQVERFSDVPEFREFLNSIPQKNSPSLGAEQPPRKRNRTGIGIGKGMEEGTEKKKNYTHDRAALPENLRTDVFEQAWLSWLAYRREKKQGTLQRTMELQLEFLAAQDDPVEVIRRSIRNGWQGLFEHNRDARAPSPVSQESTSRRFIPNREKLP